MRLDPHLPADPDPNRKENHPHDLSPSVVRHRPAASPAPRPAPGASAPAPVGPPLDSTSADQAYDRARDELAVPDPTHILRGTIVHSTAPDWPAGGRPIRQTINLATLNHVIYESDRIVWAGGAGYWRWVLRADLRAPAPRADGAIEIPLHDRAGRVVAHALVDPDDIDKARVHWGRTGNGYVCRRVSANGESRMLLLHREIMGLRYGDPLQVDHIDGDPLNNRRSNLRVVTNAQNGQNVANTRGSSPYRGVHWHAQRQKWCARITVAGRSRHLGVFDSEKDAARAAAAARVEMFTHANEERHARVAT